MTRGEAWLNHAAAVAVGGTGLVYGWMRYLAEPSDPFAVVNHPWQPALRHWHVLAAPVAVFAAGLVWRDHVWRRVRSGFRPRRPTGLVLAACLGPMVASGYLVQTTSADAWRTAWIVLHVASSCVWLVAYLVHQLSPRARPAARSPARAGSPPRGESQLRAGPGPPTPGAL